LQPDGPALPVISLTTTALNKEEVV
jgi:hypothetical protein